LDTAIDLIVKVVARFNGGCSKITSLSAVLDLPILLVDGRVVSYNLLLTRISNSLSVREVTPLNLPSFCPERHINHDGTFCLGYQVVTSLEVTDEATATVWVETLYKYLTLQERAKVKRRWPNDDAWAHGNSARFQLMALTAAQKINEELSSALLSKKLHVKSRRSTFRPILKVFFEDKHIYSVWESNKKVINLKKRCFCGTSKLKLPKRLRRCGSHATQASNLAFALRDWENEEKRYWNALKGSTCCETCDSCPLKLKVF
jgi:hypothetical protein